MHIITHKIMQLKRRMIDAYTNSQKWWLKHRFLILNSILGAVLYCVSFLVTHIILLERSTIFKILIDVNVALIGFWGLILVFILTSRNSVKERMKRERHEIDIKLNELQIQELDLKARGKGDRFGAHRFFEKMRETYNKRNEELTENIQEVETESKSLSMYASGTTVFFVISILCSVLSIALEEPLQLGFVSTIAICVFFLGIYAIFLAIWVSTKY